VIYGAGDGNRTHEPNLGRLRSNFAVSNSLPSGVPRRSPFLDLLRYGQKNRPGRYPEPEIIALRTLMTNQALEVFCQGRFPASLIYEPLVSPSPAAPSTLMPLPSRSTSAGPPSRSRHGTAPMFPLASGFEGNKIRLSLP
jgi:hypothetical protein